jgi:triosephosphate isomerase
LHYPKGMARTPVVIGNWKMELSHKGALEALLAVKKLLKNESPSLDIVICPSYPVLAPAFELVGKSTKLQLGAQNIHWEERGAWTGEVSVMQLLPFIDWCIVGHSERRQLTHETDEHVGHKAHLLLTHGVSPIICIGETREENQAGATASKIQAQMAEMCRHLTRISLVKTVIAYEPIWAIGSGETPDPASAASVMLLIRKMAAEQFGPEAAERLRIIYGGSVTPSNVEPFVAEPGVDGVLVGGASTKPGQFVDIVRRVASAAEKQ